MASTRSVSGLCWLPPSGSHQPLPLQNVHVDSTLYDLCAEVTVHQTYLNNLHSSHLHDSSSPLECVYIFPLDEDSAVFSFVAELDGVVVQGRTREKMEARAEYNAALATKRSAMLLEQSSDNVFQIKVGNLKPGSVCTVTLTYLTLMEQQGRHNRLTIPMVIAPKYTPSSVGPTPAFASLEAAPHNTIHTGYHCHHCLCSPIIGTRHHCDTCNYDLCHGCHMQHDMSHHMSITDHPPSVSPCTPSPTTVQSKLRDLTIKLNIAMPSPIVSIECPSHPNDTKITHTQDLPSHAIAFFHSTESCSLSKDFILLVEQQRCFDPRVLCELDMANNTAAVSLAFIPPPVDMLAASQILCELIFLIDCSGSMRGSSITCVRECMQLLLRSLPVHSRFNIITFGSTWDSLFPRSEAYDDTSLSAASQFISSLQANLGGTEIYPPLLHVLTSGILPTHPRQVFLLTDGQVSNVEQLVQLTSQHAVSTRLFTFGIGDAVDRLLSKKLAQAGRGKCEFVTAEDGGGAGMREKVVRQVGRAMQPVLTDVKVDWRQLKTPAMSILPPSTTSAPFLQCPSIAPAIFMSSRYILHALNVSLPDFVWQQAKAGKIGEFKCEITITAQSNHPSENNSMQHSVVLTGEQITQACVIHTMAAKERIRELENLVPTSSGEAKKKLEDEILQLALKYSLASSRTSFVAVYNAGTDNEKFEERVAVCNMEANGQSFFALPRLARSALCFSAHKPFMNKPCSLRAPSGHLRSQGATFGSKLSNDKMEPVTNTSTLFGIARAFSCDQAPDNEAVFLCRQANSIEPPASYGRFRKVSQAPGKDARATAFETLIQLQSAKGIWQVTPMLIGIVHAIIPSAVPTITMESLQVISKEQGVDEAVVGGIVALELLERYYKVRRAEWEMLATKARFFLNVEAKISANKQEDIKDTIRKLLGNCHCGE